MDALKSCQKYDCQGYLESFENEYISEFLVYIEIFI